MKKSGGTLRSRATLNFLQWSLERGAADAAHLGYVPLPSQLVTDIKKYWTASFKFSSSWGNGPADPSKPLARYGAVEWRACERLAWPEGGRPSN